MKIKINIKNNAISFLNQEIDLKYKGIYFVKGPNGIGKTTILKNIVFTPAFTEENRNYFSYAEQDPEKYDIKIKNSKAVLFYIISTAMIFISKIFVEVTSGISVIRVLNELFNNNDSKFCYNYSSVFVFLSALFLIIIFKDIKIENIKIKKTINFTGSLVLTCYLLPDERIWNFVNPNNYTENNILIIIYSLIALVSVFIICCFIELLRKNLFDLIYKKIKFENKCDLIQNIISEKFSRISDKI